jgi:carbamoyltransferase
MGLASFGEPRYLSDMRDLIRLRADGSYRLNLDYFTYHIKPGRYEGYVSPKFLAASVQKLLEEVAIHICDRLHKITRSENLCVAGGVALNSVMNYRLATETPFRNVYIQPAANDEGTSLGAAYYVYNHELGNKRNFVMNHASWGPGYDDGEMRALLEESKLSYTTCDNPAVTAARMIAEGKIVGWFQGRLEWGPRALGNRSILADPRRANMTDVVNRYVKHREDFRPFAPSVLHEYGDEYFVNYHDSPFMLEVFPVKPIAREKIPAVVHVDNTSRVQTVSRDRNPLYWELIEEFRKITDVPVVLNTSFNVRGEPIVNTPREALRCFYATGMDALVVGNYVIDKGWVPRNGWDLAPSAVAPLEVLVG